MSSVFMPFAQFSPQGGIIEPRAGALGRVLKSVSAVRYGTIADSRRSAKLPREPPPQTSTLRDRTQVECGAMHTASCAHWNTFIAVADGPPTTCAIKVSTIPGTAAPGTSMVQDPLP